ncbi:MAG: 8-oxo-dGTP diphosphatase [Clostridia bacterium]|nr:8-oxo-dGTP diphosphatase [Clostridia bacterium]
MARTEVVTMTNMCMICSGTRVLVQDRRDPDWPGVTFPGGHVEKGESFTDAVIREVYEETGLRIASPRLCGVKDWINGDGSRYMVLCYRVERFEGTPASSDEGDVYWAELDDLPKMQLAEGMETMLRLFTDETISEQYFEHKDGAWISILK